MRWLKQQLFEQLTRLDPRPAWFFDRFRVMDPESRDEVLADMAHSMTRHGHIGITRNGRGEGHFSLMVIWNHKPVPPGCPSVDLDEVMNPMQTLDEEIDGEKEHW